MSIFADDDKAEGKGEDTDSSVGGEEVGERAEGGGEAVDPGSDGLLSLRLGKWGERW